MSSTLRAVTTTRIPYRDVRFGFIEEKSEPTVGEPSVHVHKNPQDVQPFSTLGALLMMFKAQLFGLAALVAAGGGGDHNWEWGGTFDTPENTYVWTSQSTEGSYGEDTFMNMYFKGISENTDAALEGVEETADTAMGGTCASVVSGATVTVSASGGCYALRFNQKLHTTQIALDTTNVAHIAIFAQHVPTEFERDAHYLKDLHGEDVEPVHELPEAAAESTPEKPWGKTIGATFLVAVCTLIGVMFAVPCFGKLAQEHPRALFAIANAFASGAILAAAFYLMLYEATHLIVMDKESHATAWWGSMILLGFVTANILDTAIQSFIKPGAAAESPSTTSDLESTTKTPAPAGNPNKLRVLSGVLLGDFIHNFVDGIIIGAAFIGCDDNMAWGITAATVGHELAQELSDYLVLTDPNQGALKPAVALSLNFISGLSVVLGAIVILANDVDNRAQGLLLAYGGGVYLQIGAAECMARVNEFANNSRLRFSCLAAFTLGAVAIGLVLLDHEHCVPGAEGGDGHAH